MTAAGQPRSCITKDILCRSPSGWICVELCASPCGFLGPEAPVLVLGELIKAFQKGLREACAFHHGQLQRFSFQLGPRPSSNRGQPSSRAAHSTSGSSTAMPMSFISRSAFAVCTTPRFSL